jgi:hypothetical protein
MKGKRHFSGSPKSIRNEISAGRKSTSSSAGKIPAARTALGAKSSPPSRPLPFKFVTGTCVFFQKRESRVMGDLKKKSQKYFFYPKK